jgi:hypothetical protein
LNQCSIAEKLPTWRNLDGVFEEENGNISFGHDCGEICICLRRRLLKGGQRTYVSRIPAGEAVACMRAHCEMGMTGGE